MTINLYYIEGISRIDTPYFATRTSQATLSKQQEFFDNHIVKSVELSYYPPHYRNTIKFDDDDLTFNSQVNYLSLEYGNKRYYYFIDSISYLSETLVEVEITMDVIQTYMFNIYISNGIIERKFINRYSDIYINRAYIRENISDNDYVYYTSNVINSDVRKWLVFATASSYYNMKMTTVTVSYDVDLPGIENDFKFVSAYPFYIIPFTETHKTIDEVYYESASGEMTKGSITPVNAEIDASEQFSYFSSRNWVVDMYICPFDCAYGLTLLFSQEDGYNIVSFANYPNDYIIIDHYYEYSGNVGKYLYLIGLSTGGDPSLEFREHKTIFKCKAGRYSTSLGLGTKNTSLAIPYSSTRITQMIDENYIRFQFGSLSAFTTIPLYKLTRDSIYCNYAFNPSDGTRIYWITDSNGGDDKYNTVVLDSNILHYDLKNDPWVEYVSQNRSRYVAAGIDTAVTIFSKGMINTQTAKFAAQEIADIKSNPKNYDRRYKVPQLKTKPSKMIETREQDIAAANLGTKVSGISSIVGNIGGQMIKDANVRAMPATAKQIANISGVTAKQAYIMTYVERVQDYEQCAQFFHRNGFLVNEYINAKADIFSYVQNRYYFNILKMSIPNVHLHGVIEDEDTIQAITDRLVDGVRLWNVNNTYVTIGDFQFDNVENDYLQ